MSRGEADSEGDSIDELLSHVREGALVRWGDRSNPAEVTRRQFSENRGGVTSARITVETKRGATRRLEAKKPGRRTSNPEKLAELQYREESVLDERNSWEVRTYHEPDSFEIVEEGEGRELTSAEEEFLALDLGDTATVTSDEWEATGVIDRRNVDRDEVNVWVVPEDRHEGFSYSITANGHESTDRMFHGLAVTGRSIAGIGNDADSVRAENVTLTTDSEAVAGFDEASAEAAREELDEETEAAEALADEADELAELVTDGGVDGSDEDPDGGEGDEVEEAVERWRAARERHLKAGNTDEAERYAEMIREAGGENPTADGATGGFEDPLKAMFALEEGQRVRLETEFAFDVEAVVADVDVGQYGTPERERVLIGFRPGASRELDGDEVDRYWIRLKDTSRAATTVSWEAENLKAEVHIGPEGHERVDIGAVVNVEPIEVATDGGQPADGEEASVERVRNLFLLGIDGTGLEHRFDSHQYEVYVVDPDEETVIHYEDLPPYSLSTWVDQVREDRGEWEELNYTDGNVFDALVEQFKEALGADDPHPHSREALVRELEAESADVDPDEWIHGEISTTDYNAKRALAKELGVADGLGSNPSEGDLDHRLYEEGLYPAPVGHDSSWLIEGAGGEPVTPEEYEPPETDGGHEPPTASSHGDDWPVESDSMWYRVPAGGLGELRQSLRHDEKPPVPVTVRKVIEGDRVPSWRDVDESADRFTDRVELGELSDEEREVGGRMSRVYEYHEEDLDEFVAAIEAGDIVPALVAEASITADRFGKAARRMDWIHGEWGQLWETASERQPVPVSITYDSRYSDSSLTKEFEAIGVEPMRLGNGRLSGGVKVRLLGENSSGEEAEYWISLHPARDPRDGSELRRDRQHRHDSNTSLGPIEAFHVHLPAEADGGQPLTGECEPCEIKYGFGSSRELVGVDHANAAALTIECIGAECERTVELDEVEPARPDVFRGP